MVNGLDNDDLFEGLGGVEPGPGRTDTTIVNRSGRTAFDTTLVHPVSAAVIATTIFGEPRDAQELDPSFELNLTSELRDQSRRNQ